MATPLTAVLGDRFESYALRGVHDVAAYTWFLLNLRSQDAIPLWSGLGARAPSTSYKYGDIVNVGTPYTAADDPSNHWYMCVQGTIDGKIARTSSIYTNDNIRDGTGGWTGATWPEDGTTLAEGDLIWKDIGTLPVIQHVDRSGANAIQWENVGPLENVLFGYCPAIAYIPFVFYQSAATYTPGVDDDRTFVESGGNLYACVVSGNSTAAPTGTNPAANVNNGGVAEFRYIGPAANNPGAVAYQYADSSQYDQYTGVAASGIDYELLTNNWFDERGKRAHLLSDSFVALDISNNLGNYFKYMILCSGGTTYRVPESTSTWDRVAMPFFVVVDTDTSRDEGIVIPGAVLAVDVDFSAPDDGTTGILVEFDHSLYDGDVP